MGLIWGSSFMWIKIALQEVGPLTLVFFRTAFASLGLITFFIITRKRLDFKNWRVFIILGVFNVAIPFMLISWAETRISSALASILNSVVPLFTMLFASLTFKEERLTLQRVCGLFIGFLGVVVLVAGKLQGDTKAQAAGIAAMLIAVLSYAVSFILTRLTSQRVKPEDQAFGQMIFGLLLIFFPMIVVENPFHVPQSIPGWIALVWLGVMGSCVAILLWCGLIKDIGPGKTSVASYLYPLVGVLLGVTILDESLDWTLFVGGLLIIAGIIVVNSRAGLRNKIV